MKTALLEHIKQWSQKTLISVGIFSLLLIATFIAFLFPPQTLSTIDQFQVEELSALSEIDSDTTVIQSFEPAEDFDGFGLLFANYNQLLDAGTIKIQVFNQQNLVGSCSVAVRGLLDISFFYCEVPIVKGQHYELSMHLEDVSLPITFFSTATQIDGASLTIDEERQNRLIVMDFIKQRNNYMLAWLFAILANLVACYIAANMGKELHGPKRN